MPSQPIIAMAKLVSLEPLEPPYVLICLQAVYYPLISVRFFLFDVVECIVIKRFKVSVKF